MAFIGEDVLLLAVELRGGLYRRHITHKLVLSGVQVLEGSPETVWEATFACDPGYRSQWVSIVVEAAGHSDFPEAIGHDGPFYPDPSQRVVALVFHPRWGLANKAQSSCVVRSETLLRLGRERGEETSSGMSGESTPLYRILLTTRVLKMGRVVRCRVGK